MRLARFPGTQSEAWAWQLRAACRDMDSELFFAENVRGARKRLHEQAAKRVCARCPVIGECREHALRAREPYGVWGGLTPEDRRQIAVQVVVLSR